MFSYIFFGKKQDFSAFHHYCRRCFFSLRVFYVAFKMPVRQTVNYEAQDPQRTDLDERQAPIVVRDGIYANYQCLYNTFSEICVTQKLL